jgi:hypothetical protein
VDIEARFEVPHRLGITRGVDFALGGDVAERASVWTSDTHDTGVHRHGQAAARDRTDPIASGRFAMKGGTAINMFVQDMPRLSEVTASALFGYATVVLEASLLKKNSSHLL